MTNFEKYKDDLIKIEGDFAFDKNTKEIVGCNTLDGVERRIECEECIFNKGTCYESDKIKWLFSEYEEPILSNAELKLINDLSEIYGKEYKYIHRDACHVFIFSDKPNIDKYGIILDGSDYIEITGLIDLFSNIKFVDGLYDIKNKCFIEV